MNYIRQFIEDLRVEVTDEFDRNFERKGFFDEKWPDTRRVVNRGSLLMRTGALRRSLQSTSQGNSIRFFSSLPYASIQNDGGEITVTTKMKRYFWAMYKKAAGGRKSSNLTGEAEFFKAMALKKVGSRIKIPKRQFIGHHERIDQVVDKVFQQTLNSHEMMVKKQLKP